MFRRGPKKKSENPDFLNWEEDGPSGVMEVQKPWNHLKSSKSSSFTYKQKPTPIILWPSSLFYAHYKDSSWTDFRELFFLHSVWS